jgi:hypothetical protein
MNITKIIVCATSFASVGFAGDSFFEGKENRVSGAVQVVKRGRPAGGYMSVNKSMPVDLQVLGDLTNKGGIRPVRERKPNPKFRNEGLYVQPEKVKTAVESKATAAVIDTRTIAKAKRPVKRSKSPTQSATAFDVLSDNSSGHTTPVEDSASSRTSSFDFSGASSPVNDDFALLSFDEAGVPRTDYVGLGFTFGEKEGEIDVLSSPVVKNAAAAPRTPVVTEEDWQETLCLAGQDVTPFEMGGSYKGWIYKKFDSATHDFDFVDPLSPLGQEEFDKLVAEMSADNTLFRRA